MIDNLILFLASLFILFKSAEYCNKNASHVARIFHWSEFIVSFFIVAIISVFPESTISIISALKGIPQFGLGTLLGSNVADLTLVFGIVALISIKGIHVKSEILKKDFFYLLLILFPVLLGLDGHYTRVEGILLVAGGLLFFLTLTLGNGMTKKIQRKHPIKKSSLWTALTLLIVSMVVMIISAHYTIKFGIGFANALGVPPVLVALTLVSIGTCLPELLFSIRAVKTHHDQLALGDILGTVITDATIILGILAIIQPFSFNPLLIYVTGIVMFLAGVLVIIFIRSGKMLTRREGIYLLIFYGLYLILEFAVNH